MFRSIDRKITRSVLPCFHFERSTRTGHFIPAELDWVKTEIPCALGLAADLLALEVIEGRPPFQREISEYTDKIQLHLISGHNCNHYVLHCYTAGGPDTSGGIWQYAGSPQLTGPLKAQIDECSSVAGTAARSLTEKSGRYYGAAVQYSADWADISNHERLELARRRRCSITDLLEAQHPAALE